MGEMCLMRAALKGSKKTTLIPMKIYETVVGVMET